MELYKGDKRYAQLATMEQQVERLNNEIFKIMVGVEESPDALKAFHYAIQKQKKKNKLNWLLFRF